MVVRPIINLMYVRCFKWNALYYLQPTDAILVFFADADRWDTKMTGPTDVLRTASEEDETGGGWDLSTELDQVSNSDYISQQKI